MYSFVRRYYPKQLISENAYNIKQKIKWAKNPFTIFKQLPWLNDLKTKHYQE